MTATDTATSKGTLTITHTRAEGTLLDGSRKGDGVYEILKGLRTSWRSFPTLGCLGLGQSRDRAAKTYEIDRAAAALRAAGWEVEVDVDDTAPGRDVAEREADAVDRAEARADWHAEHAGKAAAASDAAYGAERRILDFIPPGQPILTGHHSEGRHRRDLRRAEALRQRGAAERDRSRYHAGRAAAAESYQGGREDIPTTLRRIKALEAGERRLQRDLEPYPDWDSDGQGGYTPVIKQRCGAPRARLLAELADIRAQLEHWRKHVAAAEAAGVKVWGPGDFAKGDFVLYSRQWFEVARVNPKSVSVPWCVNLANRPVVHCGDTDSVRPIPYDHIQGRRSAVEMAAALAGEAQPATA